MATAEESIDNDEKREIGIDAVWSLSTAKPGNGVDQLRDDNVHTYWQSDGTQPHLINIQFAKKVSVAEVSFFLNYKLDESYTPKRISLKAGSTFHDLQEVHVLDLEEPSGWISVPLGKIANSGGQQILRCHFLQVEVLAMHQSGRDTHIRQVKVYGPRRSVGHRVLFPDPSTVEMSQFSCIR